MKHIILCLLLILCTGCSSVQVADYIKAEKPYTRKIEASFDRVYEATKTVLNRYDFTITSEEDPSIYERNEYTERKYPEKSVLFFTDLKKQSGLTHLNVYLYQVGDWTDLDIRYESIQSRVKKFYTYRNDKLINQILDQIEKEL